MLKGPAFNSWGVSDTAACSNFQNEQVKAQGTAMDPFVMS